MFSGSDKNHRLVLLGVCIVVLVLGILIYAVPPGADPDPSWGFQVMRCMEQGYHFNLLVSPDPNNIAQNHSDFLSWWSPGQYLLPYLFKTLFKVNTGHAVALTITLCNFIGLWGFYMLFKRLGFTKWISAISVAFIASQQFFILPYIFYTGGEVLLFAFAGWYLYGCFSFEKINWQLLLFIFIAGLLGFFSKSSALWLFAAGVACVWINLSPKQKELWPWLRNGIVLAIPMIASLAVIYLLYLSKGENPSSASAGWKVLPETFSFPLASPLLAGFSIDELFNGLIYHPDGPIISYGLTILVLVVLAVGSIVFVISVLKLIPNKNYSLALIVVYLVANVFFSYLYLKQAAISYEGRHFRVIGLLAIPGIVYLLSKLRVTRIAFAIIWLLFICWEVKYFKGDYQVNITAPRGASGLSQPEFDKPTLAALSQLDAAHPNNAVFVVTDPTLAVELSKNRVITLDIDDMEKDDYDALRYAGNAGTVYMIMPANYVKKGIAEHVAKSFTGYKQFEVKQLSKLFYLYMAAN